MLIIGHRGAKGLAPENTLASLQAALDQRVDGIEFDVRVTRDNVPVLHHNSDIGLPGLDMDIAKCTFRDLKAIKKDMTTLEEALRFLKNRVFVVIEIKRVPSIEPIIDCIRARLLNEWNPRNILVSSFNTKALRSVKEALPEVQIIYNQAWSVVRARRVARRLGTSHIAMNQRWLRTANIRSMTKRGFSLYAFTLNDPEKAKAWQKLGLHAAFTDFPDRYRDDRR